MRRLTTIALAGAALLAPAPAGAAADAKLTTLEGTRFPDRAFVLTLPSATRLDEDSVVVRENGAIVSGVRVLPAGAADDGEFAAVLVIDASQSMRGRAIAGAIAAARTFAEGRNENQALAVITFNRQPSTILPLTTSQARIDAALADEPKLERGTRIYDAVDAALSLLGASTASAGSIIVLSDGADTGSSRSASEVVARARREGVRIFSVGLRSRTFTSRPLEGLARETEGQYAEAETAADLDRVYNALAGRLASEYLVTYRSDARPDARVHVAVEARGVEGVAVAEYHTPPASSSDAPFRRSVVERFVLSGFGMLMTVLAFGLFIAIAIGALIRRRPRSLRTRMAQFVSVTITDRRKDTARAADAMLAQAEKSASRMAWWGRFAEDLELAGIRLAPIQIALWTAVATVATAWLVSVILGGPIFAFLALAIPLTVRSVIKRKLQRTRNLFADQLPDNLQVVASAMRAGHSLAGALAVLVEDCPEPARGEFQRVIADERLGVPLDEAMGVVARRMQSRDLEQVALVAALQRDTGGNTAEVLDRVAETVRGRFELRRLVNTLTAQGRLSRWIISLLPVGLLGIMAVINPAYMGPLFTHPMGRVMLIAAGLMVVAGSLVIKRIINIKV
jgi:tight adherence protein B